MYPEVKLEPDVLFVDDGNVLTAAGSAAALDLGLHLIRRDHGAEVANAVEAGGWSSPLTATAANVSSSTSRSHRSPTRHWPRCSPG